MSAIDFANMTLERDTLYGPYGLVHVSRQRRRVLTALLEHPVPPAIPDSGPCV
jgi:hypothetical protein